MNDTHPEPPAREPRRRAEDPAPTEAVGDGPPFRRLRSGRRRSEPTAPFDAEGVSAGTDPAPRQPAAPAPRQEHRGATAESHDPGHPESHDGSAAADVDAPAGEHVGESTGEHYDEYTDVEPDEAELYAEETAAAGTIRKQRRRRRNIVMLVVLGIFAVAVAAIVLFLQTLLGPGEPEDFAGPGEGEVTFTVEPGWGPIQIGDKLVEEEIVASRTLFLAAIQEVEAENREIHPGEYQLQRRMPALEVAQSMIGTGGEKVHYVALRQNMRTGAVFEEINKATGLDVAELEALNEQPEAFGITGPATTLEGYLHPGEYRFPLETDAQGVLQLLVDATLEELTSQGVSDPEEQYRVLKIASILQAEARPKDYPVVAGAIENRLRPGNTETNGLLQVDSSVIYGLGRYSLQFTEAEKNDADNAYNTYVHPGLPPTPIGSPAHSAIEAAINPEENDFYYWVTVDTTTGETKFASTYAEHRVYQEEFRQWCAANPDICK
ncbi:endolytic transglycosylase MltG [Zafaria sp. Z1313]|uniref:endolytic transglycosylase MltG n=1 Tax=Zafaria sp. Z1313 TaxID=3423202 RepID=UPI003D302CAF